MLNAILCPVRHMRRPVLVVDDGGTASNTGIAPARGARLDHGEQLSHDFWRCLLKFPFGDSRRSSTGCVAEAADRELTAEKADHPVVCVSWDDAQAYCEWAGLRLLQRLEWEKGRGAWTGVVSLGRRLGGRPPVPLEREQGNEEPAEFGATLRVQPWGLYAQSGNVREWCADLWEEGAYERYKRGDLSARQRWHHRVLWCCVVARGTASSASTFDAPTGATAAAARRVSLRQDSVTACGTALPLHSPLLAGEGRPGLSDSICAESHGQHRFLLRSNLEPGNNPRGILKISCPQFNHARDESQCEALADERIDADATGMEAGAVHVPRRRPGIAKSATLIGSASSGATGTCFSTLMPCSRTA